MVVAAASAALVAALMPPLTPPAEAAHALDFHWGPSKLKVKVIAGSQWTDAVDVAAGYWNYGDGPAMSVVEGSRGCNDPKIGVVTVCFAGGHSSAHIHLPVRRDGHLNRAWIHLGSEEVGSGSARRIGIMCQELGHALGLDHQGGGSSCMASAYNTAPDNHDYATLAELYDHPFGFRHRHKGKRHIHKSKHCHYALIVCWDWHTHRKVHRHKGKWHWHSGS